MEILRDKEFTRVESSDDILRNEAEGVCMEIIKTCRMYQAGKKNSGIGDQNIDHWLREEMENRYFRNITRSKDLECSITLVFVRNEESNSKILPGIINNNLIKQSTVSFGNDFIVDCIKRAEKGGKYTKYFENDKLHLNKDEIENFRRLFKYIALSISEVIDPRVVFFWDREVDTKNPNYKKPVKENTRARQIIATCIYEYLISMGIPEEEISPTLINLGL